MLVICLVKEPLIKFMLRSFADNDSFCTLTPLLHSDTSSQRQGDAQASQDGHPHDHPGQAILNPADRGLVPSAGHPLPHQGAGDGPPTLRAGLLQEPKSDS